MLMFHNGRMGLVPTGACRAPLWPAPAQHWFAPARATPMAEDVSNLPPASPQSDSDSSTSSGGGAHYASPDHVTPADQSDGVFPCRWRACSRAFGSLPELSAHVTSAHADVSAGLFHCGWEGCSRGDKGFNARYKMLVHVRTHTNERPHKCSQCEKSFSRAENLKIHTRSHSGEKPYVCPVQGCNKAYSNSSDRFKHTRTHSVDKPYCCKIAGCQKRYTDPSSLRKHVKTYKHATASPVLGEQDSQIKPSLNLLPQNEMRIFETGNTTVGARTSLSESEGYDNSVKLFQRKYSYSAGYDRIVENGFKIEYISETPLSYTDDESNKLCFCKDLPCIHTSRYVTPEYIGLDSSPYSCPVQSPKLSYSGKLSSEDVSRDRLCIDESVSLKRCADSSFENIYENGALNLEKKAKTTVLGVSPVCSEAPLDLSSRKTL